MTSCNATAPIDIPTKGNVNLIAGTFNCVYDANMLSGQPVSLAQDLSHLAIKCNSNSSKVSFYTTGTYTPTEIRIYKPSLHTYSGSAADAELLIMHSINPGNQGNQARDVDGLIVSVPISLSSAASGADSGLDAIVQAANTLNAGTVAMTSSAAINQDVNANNFIPAKAYCVYTGTLPYDSCSGNYYYAVFTDPIAVAGPINNVVASGIKVAPAPALLQKSKGGPTTLDSDSGDAEEFVLYEVVNPNNDDTNASAAASAAAAASTGSTNVAQFTIVNVLWGILIMFVLWLVYWCFTHFDAIKKYMAGNNVDNASAAATD
jgi:hypothetical protein